MRVPVWVSWFGLSLHFFAGSLLTAVLLLFLTPPWGCLLASLAVGVAHEIGDRDLLPGAAAWPWNGLIDCLAFMPASVCAVIFLR